MDQAKSKRFLDAFHEIEGFLRKMTQMDSNASFRQLLDKAEPMSKPLRQHRNELDSLKELRNAIVHKRVKTKMITEVIAEPHLKTVERIEYLRDQILQPPVISANFLGSVTTCSSGDLIGPVMVDMYNQSFSQVPVYDDGVFQGLLTTDTISRWLASGIVREGDIIITEETVADVMPHNESLNNVRLIRRNCTLYDVLDYFDQANEKGQRLDALIVSNSGRKEEKPLGIITIFDLPEIYQRVQGGE